MDKSRTLIVTNRLQPIHQGHLLFWRSICHRFPNPLIICVLCDANGRGLPRSDAGGTDYVSLGQHTLGAQRNPLPHELRLQLARLALDSDDLLRSRTMIRPRPHPLQNWDASLAGLPLNRTWVFNPGRSTFDASKVNFYQEKGEDVLVLECGSLGGYSATAIREMLAKESADLSFLPKGCRGFFEQECLRFFRHRSTIKGDYEDGH